MTGTIVTRTMKDGTKRYNAVWRAEGKQKWRTFQRRKDAERFLMGAVKATHEGTYQDVTPTLMAGGVRPLAHAFARRAGQAGVAEGVHGEDIQVDAHDPSAASVRRDPV